MAATATRTKKPATRSIRLVRVPSDSRSGKIVITQDGEATTYLLTRQETEIGGIAYELRKIEVATAADGTQTLQVTKTYNSLLNGDESSCDCSWGCYGSHKKHCRHVGGLMKLHAEGRLS
jgi:hypothetical protein